MTKQDVLVGFGLRLFTLAEELGKVSETCRVMGVDRSTYYRLKAKVDRWGLEALSVREPGVRGCPTRSVRTSSSGSSRSRWGTPPMDRDGSQRSSRARSGAPSGSAGTESGGFRAASG